MMKSRTRAIRPAWKRIFTIAGVVFGLTLLPLGSPVGAQIVVEDTNLIFTPDTSFGSTHRGTIIQEVMYPDPTSAWFAYDGLNMTGVTSNLDAGSDWYVTSPGDAFGPASISAGEFPPVIDCCPTFHTAVVGTDFYLGVATTSASSLNYERNVFGWVHVVNGVMVDNAVAYESAGILVGTSTPIRIPEPIGSGLLCFGVTASVVILRRSH